MTRGPSAVPRLVRPITLLACICLAVASTVGAVVAQEASPPTATEVPSAFCAALPADEVGDALGLEMTLTSHSDTDCYWDSDFQAGVFTTLSASRGLGTIAGTARVDFPDGQGGSVAGLPAYAAFESGVAVLYVELAPGDLLVLVLDGEPGAGVGARAALADLGAAMVPRLAGVGPGESLEPEPSFVGDADLMALLPAEVAGAPAEIESRAGEEIFATSEPDDPDDAAFRELLAAHGRSVDDASIALGLYESEGVSAGILVVRVRGADIEGLSPALIDLFLGDQEGMQRSTATFAGKDVTVFTDVSDTGDEHREHVYATGDTLWFVDAPDDLVEGIFAAIP
jgi:hypothetical protein